MHRLQAIASENHRTGRSGLGINIIARLSMADGLMHGEMSSRGENLCARRRKHGHDLALNAGRDIASRRFISGENILVKSWLLDLTRQRPGSIIGPIRCSA